MRDDDVTMVVQQTEQLMSDETFSSVPSLRPCLTSDGWLPIASLLNYSPLGATVWPFGGVGVVADCLTARGSTLVELSGDSSCLRKRPLRVQARAALEWIFSDMNYHKDVHLQLLQETDGFVPLTKIVSSYSSVQQLAPLLQQPPGVFDAIRALADAVQSSSELVVRLPSRQEGSPQIAPAATSPERSPCVRRKTLAEKICSQVEWYLAAERLQAGLAERDAAKLTAQHHKQQTANLQQQLSAAQQAIASQAVGVDALRTQLEASQQLGDEAKRAAQRGAVRSRRLEASMLCLCAEIRGLEQACDAAERAAASAGARERCHVGVCVAEVAHAEATASKALELARQAAAESASAKAQCSTATTEREQSARATSEAEQSREAAVAALTAERDRALGELAAQRRVADSLRLELKKAMNAMKAGGAGAGGAGAQPGGGAG